MRDPIFKLGYEGTDITAAIAAWVITVDFTDKKEGESDELSVTIQNSDRRWLNDWFPGTGDRVTLELGYRNGPTLGPITFEIDQPEFSGAPDTLQLKGLATPVSASLRQKKTRAFENTTLDQIAAQIAADNGLTLVGSVPAFPLERVTQRNQTDLEFLRQQAADYGLIFKVESCTSLVFFRESDLEAAEPVRALSLDDYRNYRGSKESVGTYKSVKVQYLNPQTGDFDSVELDASGAEVATPQGEEGETEISSGDVLNIRERFESRAQAEQKATQALRRANRGQFKLSLDIEGDPTLSAGSNITEEGLGKLSGKYQIERIRHALRKSQGYVSSLDLIGLELGIGDGQ